MIKNLDETLSLIFLIAMVFLVLKLTIGNTFSIHFDSHSLKSYWELMKGYPNDEKE